MVLYRVEIRIKNEMDGAEVQGDFYTNKENVKKLMDILKKSASDIFGD
jgi:hypothetical protein